jgi:hypothetical protein
MASNSTPGGPVAMSSVGSKKDTPGLERKKSTLKQPSLGLNLAPPAINDVGENFGLESARRTLQD